MEKPYTGRATVADYPTHLEISIPAKRIWFFIIFFCVWMTFWCFGGLAIATSGFGKDADFNSLFILPFWLIPTTIVILTFGRMIWWMLFGKEVITVGQGIITIERPGDWFYRTKTYDLKEAANFRVQEDYLSVNAMWGFQKRNIWGFMSGGVIRFDYGLKTIKFAGNIDEAEGSYLLKRMQEKGVI